MTVQVLTGSPKHKFQTLEVYIYTHSCVSRRSHQTSTSGDLQKDKFHFYGYQSIVFLKYSRTYAPNPGGSPKYNNCCHYYDTIMENGFV